jgi:hypothetical protein
LGARSFAPAQDQQRVHHSRYQDPGILAS